jgi:acyl-coenzyme A thioesterase PaaI-like protein
MSLTTYGPFELLSAHKEDPPGDFGERRRIAAAAQRIHNALIRIEAEPEELTDWADRLEQLADAVEGHGHRDSRQANRNLFSGQATARDIFDMMDYDPVGGFSNPIAPRLVWDRDDPEGVEGRVTLGTAYQGPPGRVHGGVVAWLMDSVLSRAMHAAQRMGVTGTLKLRYTAGTPVETELTCRAHVVRQDGRKLVIEGGIWNGEEQTVEAEGIWLIPKAMAGSV